MMPYVFNAPSCFLERIDSGAHYERIKERHSNTTSNNNEGVGGFGVSITTPISYHKLTKNLTKKNNDKMTYNNEIAHKLLTNLLSKIAKKTSTQNTGIDT